MESENKTRRSSGPTYTKQCRHCGNDFQSHRNHATFCSKSCRSAYGHEQRKLNGTDTGAVNKTTVQGEIFSKPTQPPKAAQVQIMSTLPPAAALMVDLIRKESDRWETAYNKEREARHALKAANEKLRNELAEIKTDIRIKEIESKKPGGLDGVMENPMFQQVVIPALGKLVDRFVSGPMQIGSADGQLDGEARNQLTSINAWYATLEPAEQDALYQILTTFANAPTPEQRLELINRIKNLVQNGSTITNAPTGTNGIM